MLCVQARCEGTWKLLTGLLGGGFFHTHVCEILSFGDTPSVQLVKSKVNELGLRAQAQRAFGVAESHTPPPQTQSASNSVRQEGARRKACPKNSFR